MEEKLPQESSAFPDEAAKRNLELIDRNLNDGQLLEILVDNITELDPTDETKTILLVGAPGSGKTTLANSLIACLPNSAVISSDDYVRGTREWRITEVEQAGKDPIIEYNVKFMREQVESIVNLKEGEEIKVPRYDGKTGIALGADPDKPPDSEKFPRAIGPVNFLIVEGDFQLLPRDKIDMLIYLDVPDEARLKNRVARDLKDRGAEKAQDIVANFNFRQETQTVPYTYPNKAIADLIIKVTADPLEGGLASRTDRQYCYSYDVLRRQDSSDSFGT